MRSVSRKNSGCAMIAIILLLVLTCLLDGSTAINFHQRPQTSQEDPYKVLGVKRTASDADIQKAYRQRARETHPDKNPSPNANDEFRRVSDAFEILGDPTAKRQYDHRMNQESKRRRQAQEQQRRQEEQRRQQNVRKKQERQKRQREMVAKSRATVGRMVKIPSNNMEQFEKIMLDSKKRVYRTHCLIMFVSNKNAERKGEEEFYFPYPFAGEAGDGGVYDSMLQVAKVRFNSPTDLTSHFRAKSQQNTPHVIFARKGDPVGDFQVFYRSPHAGADIHGELKKWVESLLVVHATIENQHSLPVEVLVMRNGQLINQYKRIYPGHGVTLNLQAGDRIFAFDERVDKLTPVGSTRNSHHIVESPGVLLMDGKEVDSGTAHYTINSKRCYDLSTQCNDWIRTSRGKKNQQCHLNPEFMHNVCPSTCGVCSNSFAPGLSYLVFHYPIHRFPKVLQGLVRSGRYFMEDVQNISEIRKNAAAAFFAMGVLLAFNAVLFRSIAALNPQPKKKGAEPDDDDFGLSTILDSLLLLAAGGVCAMMKLMMELSSEEVQPWMKSFHVDFTGVVRDPDVYWVLLGVGAVASIYYWSLLSCIIDRKMDADKMMFFLASLLTLIGAVLAVISYMMSSGMTKPSHWQILWRFRRNAAFVILLVGTFAGVGLMSLYRLTKPLQQGMAVPVIVGNVAVLAAAIGFSSSDPHFMADILHVLELRKNAAFAFLVFGIAAGTFVIEVISWFIEI